MTIGADEKILIIAEHDRGELKPSTWELITLGSRITNNSTERLIVAVAGSDIRACSDTLAAAGFRVMAVQNPFLEDPSPELIIEILAELIREMRPSLVLLSHSYRGSEIAPALAARSGTDCLSAIEDFQIREDCPVFTKLLFNGKISIDVVPCRGCIITVQPSAFPAETPASEGPGTVTIRRNTLTSRHIRFTGASREAEDVGDLGNAEVIVAAGRGIGSEENLELLRRLAGIFTRSAIGGSRSVCDLGWVDYPRQIGMTGKTVSPKLYIACGISGASQHITGMKTSKTIIAINTDRQAAIFSVADYGIVEDLSVFIPLVLKEYEKGRGRNGVYRPKTHTNNGVSRE